MIANRNGFRHPVVNKNWRTKIKLQFNVLRLPAGQLGISNSRRRTRAVFAVNRIGNVILKGLDVLPTLHYGGPYMQCTNKNFSAYILI